MSKERQEFPKERQELPAVQGQPVAAAAATEAVAPRAPRTQAQRQAELDAFSHILIQEAAQKRAAHHAAAEAAPNTNMPSSPARVSVSPISLSTLPEQAPSQSAVASASVFASSPRVYSRAPSFVSSALSPVREDSPRSASPTHTERQEERKNESSKDGGASR